MNLNGKLMKRALLGTVILALLLSAPTAVAQEGTTTEGDDPAGLIALGAGLAIGLAGLATAIAQKDIGAAAVGAMAENEGFLGKGILMVAIPETIVILGFVIAFLLSGSV